MDVLGIKLSALAARVDEAEGVAGCEGGAAGTKTPGAHGVSAAGGDAGVLVDGVVATDPFQDKAEDKL
eukprot:9584748-Prorocentrum_lima.AAC.1